MMSKNNEEEQENNGSLSNIQQSTSSSGAWNSPQSLVGSLSDQTASRAFRTLTTTDSSVFNDNGGGDKTVNDVIEATIARSASVLEKKEETNSDGSNDSNGTSDGQKQQQHQQQQQQQQKQKSLHKDKRTYLGNPSVTPTALAHSLWQSTILPYQDTVIDATCGNGKDCLALTKMLFPDVNDDVDDASASSLLSSSPRPQLIGIDIQARAIANTQRSLLSSLPSDIYYNHVSILEQSHEHLMDVPRDTQSVGLVCYNLGYLPGGVDENYKETQTQTQTTLNSITDASLLLRVGGLLSVMTYPGSNLQESIAVEHFAEGLAMLTTRDIGGWRGYVRDIPDYDDDGGYVREIVSRAVERIVTEGQKKQTWRVFVHKPLGRPLSPVLVTAMRIK